MRPVWLIEADVFGEAADPLKAEVRRQGMACHVIRHEPFVRGAYDLGGGAPLPDDACVIFYGSFPLLRHIQLRHHWVPGGWCNADNLACATYYAYFGRFLLNQRYALLPGVEAV